VQYQIVWVAWTHAFKRSSWSDELNTGCGTRVVSIVFCDVMLSKYQIDNVKCLGLRGIVQYTVHSMRFYAQYVRSDDVAA
jgi:hypothetical protein